MTARPCLALVAAALFAACSANNPSTVFPVDAGGTDVPGMDTGRTDGGTDAVGTEVSTDGGTIDGAGVDAADVTDAATRSCTDGGVVCGTACVNTATDGNNCGHCGNACDPGQLCRVGTCVANPCPGNQYPCNNPDAGTTVCTNITTDVNNCGGCGTVCASGMQCASGVCFMPCTDPLVRCGTTCVDISSNAMNCGACGHACATGQTCVSDMCTCAPPLVACGSVCSNPASDSANCGRCGNACAAGSYCAGSVCVGCGAPRTLCSTGVCTDTSLDPAHCGGCGTSCHGAEVCVAGSCACATSAGLAVCSGACTDVQTDPANCGTCGHACPGGMSCASGSCAITTHYMAVASPPGVTFIDACGAPGANTYLANVDDGSALAPLPFAFRYWATNIPSGSNINLCSNGWLGMDGSPGDYLSGSLPTHGTPSAIVAPHWGDDHNGTPGQCVATVGVAPYRKWVAEWQNDYYCCTVGTTSLTYEVILSETSNTVDFVYGAMNGVRTQTAGIGDYTGAMAVGACPGGGTSCAPAAGSSVRFLPIP